MRYALRLLSGGIAALDHRLIAPNLSGSGETISITRSCRVGRGFVKRRAIPILRNLLAGVRWPALFHRKQRRTRNYRKLSWKSTTYVGFRLRSEASAAAKAQAGQDGATSRLRQTVQPPAPCRAEAPRRRVCKISKNTRQSANTIPHYHIVVGMQAQIYKWPNGQRGGSGGWALSDFYPFNFLSFVAFISFCSKPSYFLQKETKATKEEGGDLQNGPGNQQSALTHCLDLPFQSWSHQLSNCPDRCWFTN
jgi:hypothetical protein